MIKLLNGHSLTEKARFQPESMPMILNERQSTATITIGPAAPEIKVGDWLQDMDEPGAGIVWRVKTVDTQYETKTRTLRLEHVINSLRDRLMFGEVKPADMSGTPGASSCTAEEAVRYILDQQSDWTLGQFDYSTVSNPYNFNGEDLFSAIETVCSSLEHSWWSFNTTVYPFVLNITHRATAIGTELRLMRNISTAKMTVDKSRMFTRLYPIGKNNLHIDGDYISQNEELYGVISKTETDQSKGTKADLLRWARERIANHSEPAVTVTVGVIDLSRETGESLDHIQVGVMCRMPLPGFNTTVEETITQLSYPDKIRDPEEATATLANIQDDVASIINNLIKRGGGGGRAAAKNAEEDHAWFEDTTDHVAMIAEGIAGEGAAQDWSRVAELLVDGDGIHQRVTQAQADIVEAYSLIDQTTTAIRLEIANVQSGVQSFIEMTPEMIHSEVSTAVSGIAHSVIEQTATYIRSEVENATSEISQTVIEQTTQYIQTTVEATASEVAWSVITQTMTNIEQQIARKSKTYIQPTDPNDGTNVLYDGDIWVKREDAKTWNDTANMTWDQLASRKWESFYGDYIYVWKNGAWKFIKNTAVDVENEVKLEQTSQSIALIGTAVDAAGNVFNSNLEVTARQIRSETSTAQSRIYSVVEQTATQIRSKVADEVAGLQSIIEQTASQIRTEVSNTASGLRSSITQQANKIALVVGGTDENPTIKSAEIVASINNGSSSIKLSAEHIDIEGVVTQLGAYDIGCGSLQVEGFAEFYRTVEIGQGIAFDDGAGMSIGNGAMTVGGYSVSWKSKSIQTLTLGNTHRFTWQDSGGSSGYVNGQIIIGSSSSTIYYLGR